MVKGKTAVRRKRMQLNDSTRGTKMSMKVDGGGVTEGYFPGMLVFGRENGC